jgi:hypothetical protein
MKLKRKATSTTIAIVVGVLASAMLAAAATLSLNTSNGPTNNAPVFQGFGSTGGQQQIGSTTITALGAPGVPVVTNNGTAGSTSINYYCVATDINGNDTLASSVTTNTTSNATLSATNSNTVFCPGQSGAIEFKILKTNTSTLLGTCYTTSGAGCSVTDAANSGNTSTYTSVTNGASATGPVATDNTNTLVAANGCSGSAKAVAGSVEVTAPCVSAFSICGAGVQLAAGVTPVAGDQAACTFTSTATVVNSATITVGAVQIEIAGTPSPSPTVSWWVVR